MAMCLAFNQKMFYDAQYWYTTGEGHIGPGHKFQPDLDSKLIQALVQDLMAIELGNYILSWLELVGICYGHR